jgi:hypothetical protein
LILDVLNRKVTEDQMARELLKRGIPLKSEQIRNFLLTQGVPKDLEAVQLLVCTPEVQEWIQFN